MTKPQEDEKKVKQQADGKAVPDSTKDVPQTADPLPGSPK